MNRKPAAFLIAAAAGLTCGMLLTAFWRPRALTREPAPLAKPVTELREMYLEEDAPALEAFLAEAAGYTPPRGDELARWWSGKGSRHAVLAAVDAGIALLRAPDDAASRRELIGLLNSSDPSFHSAVWPELMRRWAAAEPESAAAAAVEIRDETARTTLLFEAFTHLGKRDFDTALTAAEALPAGSPRAAAVAAVFHERIKTDSKAVADLMLELEQADRVTESLPWAMLIREWNDPDPAAPLRWAMGIEDPAKRSGLMERYFGERHQWNDDRVRAHALLMELAADPRNANVVSKVAWSVLTSSQVDGLTVYDALPEEGRAELLQNAVSISLLANRPDKTRLLREKFTARGEPETFFQAGTDTAITRGEEGLRHWGAWLAGGESGQEPAAALENLAREAAERSPFAAAEWLATLKPSPERDRAVKAFAEVHAAADPERALAWARSIGDPALRGEAERTARERLAEGRDQQPPDG